MLGYGDRCIVAVSGGADSTALLHALVQLNKIFKIQLRVVHVHHGLRAEEADRDAEFVKSLCVIYKIKYQVIYVDVNTFAAEQHMSTEEAARYLRYQALEKAATDWEEEEDTTKQVKIAVAHNKDDDAETILMQLVRGSGLKGIGGIRPIRGRIIRPLLFVSRAQIENYLKKEEKTYITDSTNLCDDYTRNRIRHDIIPRLTESINKAAIENITRAGKLIGSADLYLSKTAEKIFNEHEEREGNKIGILTDVLKQQDIVIINYILRLMINRVNKSMKDITSRHIDEMQDLIFAQPGKKIDLPYRLVVIRTYDKLMVYKKHREHASVQDSQVGDVGKLIFKTLPYHGMESIPSSDDVKWFDYDKIEDIMNIRTRKIGDYIELNKVGKKSVKSFMTDAKIPAEIRSSIPILAVGNHVMWIVGYRISEYYKVTSKTKKILEVIYRRTV